MGNYIIALGQFILVLALLPTVLGPDKPALATCLITAPVLSTFVYAFYTMKFWASMGTSMCSAVLWWVLVGQVSLA